MKRESCPYFMILGGETLVAQWPAACVDPLRSSTQEADLRMPLHKIELRHKTVWGRNVVGVHNGDVSPLREETARIACFSQTAIRYLMEHYSIVSGRIARSDHLRLVCRAEVNDDELKILESLAEYAFDRLCKKVFDVAYHHDDRNDWFVHLLDSFQ